MSHAASAGVQIPLPVLRSEAYAKRVVEVPAIEIVGHDLNGEPRHWGSDDAVFGLNRDHFGTLQHVPDFGLDHPCVFGQALGVVGGVRGSPVRLDLAGNPSAVKMVSGPALVSVSPVKDPDDQLVWVELDHVSTGNSDGYRLHALDG